MMSLAGVSHIECVMDQRPSCQFLCANYTNFLQAHPSHGPQVPFAPNKDAKYYIINFSNLWKQDLYVNFDSFIMHFSNEYFVDNINVKRLHVYA